MRLFQLMILTALALSSFLVIAQHFENNQLIFPERRILAFTYKGANEEIIKSTLPRIVSNIGNEPGSWVYEWSKLASYYEDQGDDFVEDGYLEKARDSFLISSNYYAMAWFPNNYLPEEKVAYQDHLRTYLKAGNFFDSPLEVIDIPFRGSYVKVYMHKPVGIEKPPLILYTQGADQFKANAFPTVSDLVEKGFAVGTFDLLGTGENENWKITPSGDELHLSILDYFINTNGFDNSRISFVGFSFGGYYAAKLASRNDPRIKSIISFCPVFIQFTGRSIDQIDNILRSPEGAALVNLLRKAGAENPRDAEEALEILSSFSLHNQGLVGSGKNIATKLLIANGTNDPLGPVQDMHLLYNSAINADLWLLGGAEHCAVEYLPITVPHMADWILNN